MSGSEKELHVRYRLLVGRIIRDVYNKFGDEALPVISEIFVGYGRDVGKKLRERTSSTSLTEVGPVIRDFMNETGVEEPVEMPVCTEERVVLRLRSCGFGLGDVSRKICEALLSYDKERINCLTDGKANVVEIVKSLPDGDEFCEIRITAPPK